MTAEQERGSHCIDGEGERSVYELGLGRAPVPLLFRHSLLWAPFRLSLCPSPQSANLT